MCGRFYIDVDDPVFDAFIRNIYTRSHIDPLFENAWQIIETTDNPTYTVNADDKFGGEE